jgi:hypothetical protein
MKKQKEHKYAGILIAILSLMIFACVVLYHSKNKWRPSDEELKQSEEVVRLARKWQQMASRVHDE